MGQWTFIYDMFWSAYGGNVEWLYVRPEHRGSGVVAAIVAEISARVRDAGGEWKPSKPLLILRGWHLGTSFAASRIPG